MRNFNFGTFLAVALASGIADLVGYLLIFSAGSMSIPYHYRDVLKWTLQVPWSGAVFGLCFSIALSVVLVDRVRIGFNEIVGMVLICPLIQFSVPKLLSLTGPMMSGLELAVYLPLANSFFYAVLIGMIARAGLFLEIGSAAIVFAGLIGAGVTAANALPYLPFSPDRIWYLCVGGFLGIFASRMAHRDYGLRLT